MTTRVLFGGCFDLLHAGHLMAIDEAARQGGELVIQIASDEEIKHKKGNSRPIIPEEERWLMVSSLRVVDAAFIWPGLHDPRGIIHKIRPDILILNEGGHYPLEEELSKEFGFEIVYIPRFIPASGLDTTKIIEKINGHRPNQD